MTARVPAPRRRRGWLVLALLGAATRCAHAPEVPEPGLGFRQSPSGQRMVVLPGGTPMVLGTLMDSEIDQIVHQNWSQIRTCYQNALSGSVPGFDTRLVLRFVISPEGNVARRSSLAKRSPSPSLKPHHPPTQPLRVTAHEQRHDLRSSWVLHQPPFPSNSRPRAPPQCLPSRPWTWTPISTGPFLLRVTVSGLFRRPASRVMVLLIA